MTRAEFGMRVKNDYERWGKMVEAVGLMRKD
jgi:hypothetical protein